MRRLMAMSLVVISIIAAIAVGVSTRDAGARQLDKKLTLVAYSTPREAYGKIISEFEETAAGRDVSFEQSYGASGEQARAVKAGLKADVVALSLEPDVTYLVKAGLINPTWKKDKWEGIVTRSVVVFAVRRGNPKKIKDWEDLVKPGIDVVTPNVQTSGGAKWNVMAAYGAMRKKGKTHKQAVAYLRNLYGHVVSQDKSAREALQTFLAGRGDVLLAYENEAIFANSKGQDVPYIVPKATIRIDNPVAILKKSKNRAAAGRFVNFIHGAKAQQIFGQNGYRPTLPSVLKQFKYPQRPWLFTIKSLGGWASVDKRFFDPRTGIVTKIQKETS
jgi:sulfate/thiosulfate transport system substrate-binding protein